ncbi:exporter of the RND superfamily protein-like protein [Denitrovibrio acetiphilus DSM 12809]|uniref:Exporter of the RND superfamily protein-like protein n=1 Tax=Denitrovibrio acetiphilus (strain DSM 12809 / NBRC 114555 / N2460) TaxID=522772 RepID=D4H8N2_DENA2|nr:MMPL family transporter [Denitrovibrio acetiphilus]ADD68381.1 exporter of the RND superfamily protein-like protein [Denitrovibrio acetiphilus DSM 12809]
MKLNYIKISEWFSGLAGLVVRFRWFVLAAVVFITLLFVSGMKNLTFDNSSDIWFVEGDESVVIMEQFEEAFGNDEFLSLFLKADANGRFTPEMLRKYQDLMYEIETEVPYVKKVTWLGNVEWIESTSEGLDVGGFMDPIPDSQDRINAFLDMALTEPSYVNAFLNRGKNLLAMHIELYHYGLDSEDRNPRYSVAEPLYQLLESDRYADLDILAAGGPAMSYKYDKLVAQDGKKFFMMTVIVMFALLAWVGRGFRGVILPLVVVVLPVFWTMGAIPLMGFKVNFLTMALPTILICVGIADSMHYISAFHDYTDSGFGRRESLKRGLGITGRAILLTTITTMVGFLSFLTTHVQPFREMGLYVALGVFFAMVATVMLVPSIFSFGREGIVTGGGTEHRNDIFDKILYRIFKITTGHPWKIVVVFVFLVGMSVYGLTLVKVESNTMKLIKQGNPFRDSLDYIDANMGGVLSLEFMLDTGRDNGIKTSDFMKKLDRFHMDVESYGDVTKVSSITSVIKKMRKALHNNNMDYYEIPGADSAVSQYLFMYETSGGDEMDKMVTFLSDKARVTVKTKSLSTYELKKIKEYAEMRAEEIFGDEVSVLTSGSMYRYIRLNDILGEGQRNSFIAAMIAVGIIMLLLMRSPLLGIISLVPNVFPVMISLGLLGLAGAYVDVILMSFAPVIIGVAVDDTIHFFTRFKREFDMGSGYEDALKKTYMTVGRPIVFSTMVLALGFAPFMLSQLTGYVKNGFMMGWAFSWALIADFFLAPALIMILKPMGKKRR